MAVASISLDLIDFGERGRKDYGDLTDFCGDISHRGLICPIAIIDKKLAGLDLGDSTKPYLLAAGGRRFTAANQLGWDSIECKIFDHTLTEYDYRAIELFENLKRKDLSPKEAADMKAELHRMYVDLYGEKVAKTPDAPGHSIRDTAEMLGINPGHLSRDLKLKNFMDQFPEMPWEKCKTNSDMHKLANKMQRTLTNAVMAEEVTTKLNNGTSSLAKTLCDAYLVGDFFDLSASLPNNYYDFAEIDPPYAIDLAKKKKGNTCDGYNEIDKNMYQEFMFRVLQRCYEKLKPNSWLVCWFGPDPWFSVIADLLRATKFQTTGLVGIWAKGQETDDIISSAAGQTHMPNSRLANSYEMFYYAWKGSPELNKPGSSNLFGCVPVAHQKKWHPTQRPRPLIRSLLSTFVGPGSNVLVPFAGSGETLISAFKEKMYAVGFDLQSSYKDAYVVEVGKEFK